MLRPHPLIPKLVFGTSFLGNLFEDIGYEHKKNAIAAIVEYNTYIRKTDSLSAVELNNGSLLNSCMFDCAGKYGGDLKAHLQLISTS